MKIYKSKIGLELVIPLTIIFGGMLYNGITSGKMNIICIALALIAFISYTFLTTEYSIDNSNLKIKCGLFFNTVLSISHITKISETYNLISSPAASLDRLEIKYKEGSVLISPKDKKAFIDSIKAINPDIKVIYRKNKP